LTPIAVELSGKRLELLKEASPRMTRVALLVNPNNRQDMLRYIEETRNAALALGLDVQPVEVRSL
jgi:putative ABC transport system substrate-binding protein